MHRLLHRLVDHLLPEAEQGADPGGLARAEMRDVVDLVLVQADRAHEIDVDLVSRGEPADQVAARSPHRLCHGKDRRDVVAGMRVVLGQERVVHIEFAHRGAVRPRRPFRTDTLSRGHAEHGGGVLAWMPERHVARGDHRMAVDRTDCHSGVIDHAVNEHGGDVALDRHAVGGDRSDLPGELILALQVVLRWVHLHVVQDHAFPPLVSVGDPS